VYGGLFFDWNGILFGRLLLKFVFNLSVSQDHAAAFNAVIVPTRFDNFLRTVFVAHLVFTRGPLYSN
jgi:hypothetical protein